MHLLAPLVYFLFLGLAEQDLEELCTCKYYLNRKRYKNTASSTSRLQILARINANTCIRNFLFSATVIKRKKHALQDLNSRHQVLETCVLPTELKAFLGILKKNVGSAIHLPYKLDQKTSVQIIQELNLKNGHIFSICKITEQYLCTCFSLR